jgi:hypothetical protein
VHWYEQQPVTTQPHTCSAAQGACAAAEQQHHLLINSSAAATAAAAVISVQRAECKYLQLKQHQQQLRSKHSSVTCSVSLINEKLNSNSSKLVRMMNASRCTPLMLYTAYYDCTLTIEYSLVTVLAIEQ